MSNRQFHLTGPPPLTEKQVIEGCLSLLAHHRYWYARLHAGRFRTPDLKRWIMGVPTGTPDYVCMRGHNGFLVEFKRPGGTPDPMQVVQAEKLRDGNELTVVCIDSVEMMSRWLRDFEASVLFGPP